MEYVFSTSKTFWYDQLIFFKPGIIVCIAVRHHPCPLCLDSDCFPTPVMCLSNATWSGQWSASDKRP